jgi:rhodanese-related sulfurtransferase
VAEKHSERFLTIVHKAKMQIRECSIHDVNQRRERGEKFHLVDVREESEFAKSHITGAIHIGKGIIERDIEKHIPDTSDEIILYCGGGYRSALAAANLREMGYDKVFSMDGGFRGWKEAGYPVEEG